MTDLNSLSFEQLVPSKSKYLTKDDVGEDGKILTVRGFRNETIESDEGNEDKIVMYFMEKDVKPMILNRTNSQLIALATGAKTAGEAKGKKIRVYNDPNISFGKKLTGGLRIKKAEVGNGAPADPDLDDDIPF